MEEKFKEKSYTGWIWGIAIAVILAVVFYGMRPLPKEETPIERKNVMPEMPKQPILQAKSRILDMTIRDNIGREPMENDRFFYFDPESPSLTNDISHIKFKNRSGNKQLVNIVYYTSSSSADSHIRGDVESISLQQRSTRRVSTDAIVIDKNEEALYPILAITTAMDEPISEIKLVCAWTGCRGSLKRPEAISRELLA